MSRAFITYVRPLLEYTSPVWSPSHLYLINEIENVQRSFTKRLPGLSTLSYSERLIILNLPTLEYRRLIADLIICFNIVHGFSCMNTDSVFTLSRNSSLRGHQFRFRVPLSKSNLRKFFFAHRVVQVWNSLPASIVAASSTRAFKALVMKLDLSKFLHIVTWCFYQLFYLCFILYSNNSTHSRALHVLEQSRYSSVLFFVCFVLNLS